MKQQEFKISTSIRLKANLVSSIDKVANKDRRSRSFVIESILEEWLERNCRDLPDEIKEDNDE